MDEAGRENSLPARISTLFNSKACKSPPDELRAARIPDAEHPQGSGEPSAASRVDPLQVRRSGFRELCDRLRPRPPQRDCQRLHPYDGGAAQLFDQRERVFDDRHCRAYRVGFRPDQAEHGLAVGGRLPLRTSAPT